MQRMKSHSIEVHDWVALAKGRRVGIDTMVWLHVFIERFKNEKDTQQTLNKTVVGEVVKRLQKIISRGVHAIPVLDGSPTAAKDRTIQTRNKVRDRRVADLEIKEGISQEEKEKQLAQAKAMITHDLVDCLLQELRKHGIPFIVAPHEADHQLAHMAQKGYIDYIITVDSDLMCHRGTKIIVTKRGEFFNGVATLFTPGEWQQDTIAKDDIGILISKALQVVRGKEYGLQQGDEEVGAAVCLGYALLVGKRLCEDGRKIWPSLCV
jgi:predicted nucleic acid-binding protein